METNTNVAQSGQYLSFTLRGQPYAVPIARVKEINQMIDITPVPESPDYVQGVLNLRGKIIPVVDLGKRFNLIESSYTKQSCIIVIESVSGLVGVIVDTVREVVEFDGDCIESSPNLGRDEKSNYISGMGKTGKEVFILLDMEEVFSIESLQNFASPQSQAS